MASLILAGAGLIASATITGFAFAGGALAFQRSERFIETKISERFIETKIKDARKPGKIHEGDRARNEGKNPFNQTRFLNNLEKRELNELLKK
jgi:hypothetical protein